MKEALIGLEVCTDDVEEFLGQFQQVDLAGYPSLSMVVRRMAAVGDVAASVEESLDDPVIPALAFVYSDAEVPPAATDDRISYRIFSEPSQLWRYHVAYTEARTVKHSSYTSPLLESLIAQANSSLH